MKKASKRDVRFEILLKFWNSKKIEKKFWNSKFRNKIYKEFRKEKFQDSKKKLRKN